MRTPAVLLITLFIVLAAGPSILSQTPNTDRIQLQGVVRDAETGNPLPNVRIYVVA